MSSAVQLVPQSSFVSAPNVVTNQVVKPRVSDLEDQFVATSRPTARHCLQEFGTLAGVLPRMPIDRTVGPVGANSSAAGGALTGLAAGLLLWGPLGITAIAVHHHPYHSVLRGVLFLAIGIPAFVIIGALIGKCLGSRSAAKAT